VWDSVGFQRNRNERKNSGTHMTPTLLHAVGEKLSCKIDVQRLIKKDQVMVANNCAFCCGRESPPDFATAARDLPQAFCLLVRREVERLMTNSNKVFTSISTTPFPGIKAKLKFAFRVIYFSLALFQHSFFFLAWRINSLAPFRKQHLKRKE